MLAPWYRRTCRAVVVHEGRMAFSHMVNRNQYVLPGGGFDPGETPQACAQRECMEELGLEIEPSEVVGIVREYYDGILRYENLYLNAELTGLRGTPKRTDEEIGLGIEECWLDLQSIRTTLLQATTHLMPHEFQVEHVQRAIANCHMRELLGISAVLGWPWEPIAASRTSRAGIVVDMVIR